MTAVNSLLRRDLGRMVGSDETKLFGRPNTNPDVLAEDAFMRSHGGMTRMQWRDYLRAMTRQEFEAETVKDLAGEPPDGTCDVKGLSPKRALYVRYVEWRRQIERELHDLQAKKFELETMVSAPSEAERAVRHGIRQTANQLLGRGDANGEADAKGLADRLAVAQHRAEAAKFALEELEQDIDRATLRVAHIESRESEFLHSVLIDLADEAGIGKLYLQKIAELKNIAALLFGLIETVHTYDSGFSQPQGPIKFPRINMPSITGLTEGDLTIDRWGSADIWKGMIASLRTNPRQNFTGLKAVGAPADGYSCWPWRG